MNLFPDFIATDERLAAHEVNYTPIGVVRQGLEFFKSRFDGFQVKRFLDPSAGQGVYCKVVRELWPKAHITAVEIREEEREGLGRVADVVRIEPFDPGSLTADAFDLIATNPPFSFTRAWVDMLKERDVAAFILFLDKTQAFQRSVEGVDLMMRRPPAQEYRVAQSVKCRAKGSGDAISYSHWLWDGWQGAGDASWKSYQLPCLPIGDRKH